MTVNDISEEIIAQIARQVFGNDAKIENSTEIRPLSENGVPKVMGCNGNVSYTVNIKGYKQAYLFRFNRGHRENLYEHETDIYKLISEKTDIPTPQVYHIDQSCTTAPTAYIVMDWMKGDHWSFLSHPQNPQTTIAEKNEILSKVGFYYAQVHSIRKPTEEGESTSEDLLARLEQLQHVVEDGQFDIDLDKIETCRRAIKNEKGIDLEISSLCIGDSEFHFRKSNGHWDIAFICDTEWVDYGDSYHDLSAQLCYPEPMWALQEPLGYADVNSVPAHCFFKAYDQVIGIDYERLRRLATYSHFGLMCSITDQIYRPEKRESMKSREPIYIALLDAIAGLLT